MLNILRRNREKLKYVLLLVILALTVTTLLLFVDTPGGIAGGPGVRDVATVGDEVIGADEFQRVYRQIYETYRDIYKLDEQPPEIVQQLQLPQQALNQLITGYAIAWQAREMGLNVSDQELRDEIASFPGLQINGQFIGAEQYARILRNAGVTPREFEAGLRRDLLSRKLRAIVTDGIEATENEVRRSFLEQHQQVKLRYVLFDTQATPEDPIEQSELQAFYQANEARYRQEELRTLEYIDVPIDPDSVTASEDQIARELSRLPEQEQAHVRHILVRSRDGDDNEAEARAKATGILRQIQAGEDFAQLARLHTDDATTRAAGGDMGFISRGQTVPEFENVAFAVEPGAVHPEVVKTPFGFHIIQTLAKTTASREGMRPLAEHRARQAAAREQAETLAGQLVESARGGASLQELATQHQLSVRTSEPITSAGSPARITLPTAFKQQMFSEPAGSVLDVGATPAAFIVGRVGEVTAGRLPAFDEVADLVSADYLADKSSDLARARADAFFKKSAQSSLEEAAMREGRRVIETGFWLKSTEQIDQNLLFSPEIKNRAFSMQVGQVSPPVIVRDKFVIFEVAERSEVDEAEYETEKRSLREQLTETRRQEFFSEYLQNVLQQMRDRELISVNTQLIDQIAGLS